MRLNPKLQILLLAWWLFFGSFVMQSNGQGGIGPGSNQPGGQIEPINYPGSVAMTEATARLNEDKPSTWIVAQAYHTNDPIKDVIKHFKMQVDRLRRTHKIDGMTASLMRDNWKIRNGRLAWPPAIFFVGDQLKAAKPDEKIETTLGVLPLADSILRVHLMSPHPGSANNNELTTGTMITLVHERVPQSPEVAAEEQVYTGRDVTRRVRIKSKPEPDHPGGKRRVVILKAILGANGKVTKIVVVGGGMDQFTAAAIEAARKIEFEPAIKDGRYVSVWVQLEYHFH